MESLNSMHGLELKFEFVNATPELRIQVLRHFDSLTPIMQCKGNIGFQCPWPHPSWSLGTITSLSLAEFAGTRVIT